jgi:hypothetical protein
MTVWIYVDTSQQVGDKDHLKVFAIEVAAEIWIQGERPGRRCVRIRGPEVNSARAERPQRTAKTPRRPSYAPVP